jgi:hypothetical protein
MEKEYKILFKIPNGFDPSALLRGLPSPIKRPAMLEIYNYSIESDGFYFVDRGVDNSASSVAFMRFVDEALNHSKSLGITKL